MHLIQMLNSQSQPKIYAVVRHLAIMWQGRVCHVLIFFVNFRVIIAFHWLNSS